MSEIDVSKIPADVMATAEAACRDIGIGNSVARPIDVALAILTERAACAQHAFAMRWAPPLELQGTKEADEISKILASWSNQVGMSILNRGEA